MLVPMHQLDLRSHDRQLSARQMRILVSECIPPSWVPLISWHQFITFMPCPVGLASSMRSVPFCTLYFNDPWTLPSLTMSCEGQSHIGMEIPLSVVEIVYQAVLDSTADPDPVSSQIDEENLVLKPRMGHFIIFLT
jgi:hypothetical protein